MKLIFSFLLLVGTLVNSALSYDVYSYEGMCGKTISLEKDAPPGVIIMDRAVPQTNGKSCDLSLITPDEDLIISIALKGVHFASCKESRLQINGFNALDDAASAEFNQEIVFDTNPHFCGKEVVSDQAILVNQGYFNPKIVLSYSGQNPTKPDFFEFYYSVHSALDGFPVWPEVTTTPGPTSKPTETTQTATTTSEHTTTTESPTTTTESITTTQPDTTEAATTQPDTTTVTEPSTTTTEPETTTTTTTEPATTTKQPDKTTTEPATTMTQPNITTTEPTVTTTQPDTTTTTEPATTTAQPDTTTTKDPTTTTTEPTATTTQPDTTEVSTMTTQLDKTTTTTKPITTTEPESTTTAEPTPTTTLPDATEASTTTTQHDTTTTTQITTTTTEPEMTTTEPKAATTLPDSTEAATTTTQPDTTTTTKPDPTTTAQPDSTTTQPDTTTTTKPDPTTTQPDTTTLKPTSKVTKQAIATRTCKCELWVRGYGSVGEDTKLDLSFIARKFVSGAITNSNCHDQYRCNQICDEFMSNNLPKGLMSKRRQFSEETVGDFLCTSIGKPILANRSASVALVASADGCTGHSFVSTLNYKFCCGGANHAIRAESCSAATLGKSTKEIPTTTSSTTTTTTTIATTAIPRKRCNCHIVTSIRGEEDKKIDVGFVTYKYVSDYITDTGCTQTSQCTAICRKYKRQNLPDELETLRTIHGKATAGDEVCYKIGHQVLSDNPARVTLVSSMLGCPAKHVATLDFRMCCVGRPYSLKAIECHRADLHKVVIG